MHETVESVQFKKLLFNNLPEEQHGSLYSMDYVKRNLIDEVAHFIEKRV